MRLCRILPVTHASFTGCQAPRTPSSGITRMACLLLGAALVDSQRPAGTEIHVTVAHPASPPPLFRHWQPPELLLFRALQIGDMLCAIPALRALRRQLPQTRITLLGLPWASDLAQRYSDYIDEFIEFPGYEGLPERVCDPAAWPAFVASMRQRQFDLALQLHGDGSIVNGMLLQLEPRRMAGFCPRGSEASTADFMHWPDSGSEIDRLLALTEFLGAAGDEGELEFPLSEDDRLELQHSGLASGLLPRSYICLHPGARDERRRWPTALFARVGDALQRMYGLPVVITGSAAEHELAQQEVAQMQTPALNAAARISIGAMAVLLNAARLLICNDTGVSHIAAGLGLPSVVIFRASDAERWGPLDQELHRRVHDPEGVRFATVLDQATQLLAHCSFS